MSRYVQLMMLSALFMIAAGQLEPGFIRAAHVLLAGGHLGTAFSEVLCGVLLKERNNG